MIREIRSWFQNIRFYMLVISVIVSVLLYSVSKATSSSNGQHIYTIMNWYALTSLVYLYLALLAGPVTKLFPRLPFRAKYLKSRRALGASAFFFALLHVRYSFFDMVGGVEGFFTLPLLTKIFSIAGTLALTILFLMAATSFDRAVDSMGFVWWKRLHTFVYLAAFFIVIHASMLGFHFVDKTHPVALIFYSATALVVALHLFGLYRKHKLHQLRKK